MYVHRTTLSASYLLLYGTQPDREEARKRSSTKEEEAEAEGSFSRLLRSEVRWVEGRLWTGRKLDKGERRGGRCTARSEGGERVRKV